MRPIGVSLTRLRSLAVLALSATALLPAPAARAALPPIYHVYVIALENESASTTFGPNSPAPFLSKTLRAQGAYLPNYYGVAHASLGNYIAMISGQAPNLETQVDCPLYSDFLLGGTGSYGQETGLGCVYPADVPTIATQFEANGLVWEDFNDGMGADPRREAAVCGHPALGALDGTQTATASDQYATRHNPFVYFHSIIDNTALCDTHVLNLDLLPQSLAGADAANYTFITPNLCNDGHDASCPDGGPGGLPRADAFLREWVPRITGSPSFQHNGGLLVITSDEAATSDTRACCGEIAGPGSPLGLLTGAGGGEVGAVLISPYIRPGTVSNAFYNHYSMLRSVEDIYHLPHLGYAQLPGESSFGSDVFTCTPPALGPAVRGRFPAGSMFTGAQIERVRRRVVLALSSVRAGRLAVVVRQVRRRHRRSAVITRWVAPCGSYALGLPGGHGQVTVSVAIGDGKQVARLRY